MYKTLVRSHLDYYDTTHSGQTNSGVTLNSSMERVERTQYQAALAITGTWQGFNLSKCCEELGWETLSECHWFRRILQIHKIKNNMTPFYLRYKLPPNSRLLYRCGHPNTFHEIRCKTSRYKNSFFPDAINLWNNINYKFPKCPNFH